LHPYYGFPNATKTKNNSSTAVVFVRFFFFIFTPFFGPS